MADTDQKLKRVCRCENCGNEAEMVVTCSLEDINEAQTREKSANPKDKQKPIKVKGSATCTNCGNEADMWIDY